MKSKLYAIALWSALTLNTSAQVTPESQMEKLDRGLIAYPAANGNFISWRLLGTDDDATTFDVLRNGSIVVAKNLTATNTTDASGNSKSTYQIIRKVNGTAVDTSKVVNTWSKAYLTIQLDQPATGAQGGTYSPNDCSVGDVDGDGEYEIILKWDPSTAKDNSQSGKTDNVYLDCYKLDGTKLWCIDLGVNIRAGAHYTQFQVYDYDGDGKAEMICKTGPGSKDGKGKYVSEAATDSNIKNVTNNASDLRNSNGRISSGQEWLTVFNGLTGEAIHTIFYNPNRNMQYGGAADGSANWDDRSGKTDKGSYGNRGERFLAATAYLGGPDQNPSAIFCRGYYTYAFIWAVDFDGRLLHQRWLSSHKSKTSYELTTYDASGNGTKTTYTNVKAATRGSGSATMYGNGNHNMSIADVDGDGCDEIIWGSAALNNNGRLLYATGFGHGDAIHLADHCPDRPGLELFQIHEESPYGWDLHDAATGEVLYNATGGDDNGRGMAGAFDAKVRGSLFWSSNDGSPRSAVTGQTVYSSGGSSNFRIYWSGDLQDELLDGNIIDKWNDGYGGTSRLFTSWDVGPSSTCNGTKKTPNLQADILGDWREELILHNGSDQLVIYSTTIPTSYSIPTLMHDHTYRMAIAWQNSAYNQPPHLGYYLPDAMVAKFLNVDLHNIAATLNDSLIYVGKVQNVKTCLLQASFTPDGTRKAYNVPEDFERPVFNKTQKSVILKGKPQQLGNYRFAFKLTGLGGETVNDTLTVVVSEVSGIKDLDIATENNDRQQRFIYDAAGRLMPQQQLGTLPRGLYIIREGNRSRKIIVK